MPGMLNRGSHWRLTLGAALLLLLTACSSDDGAGAATSCPAPKPASSAETGLLPDKLSFDGIGTVTHVVSTDGHLTVQAVTDKPLDEVTVLVQDAVTAAGYRPAGMDNEGSEAEVFFNAGSYAAGQAIIRHAECDGQWKIDLVLVDPDVAASTTNGK